MSETCKGFIWSFSALTTGKTLVVNDKVSSSLRQTIELLANLGEQSGEVGKTLLFRFDHLSRGAGNKAFVAKFGFALGDFAFEAGDFLRETVAFGGEVDFNLEHQLEVADDGHGSDRAFVRTVHVLNVLDGLKAGEGMNVRGGFEALRFGTCDDERAKHY